MSGRCRRVVESCHVGASGSCGGRSGCRSRRGSSEVVGELGSGVDQGREGKLRKIPRYQSSITGIRDESETNDASPFIGWGKFLNLFQNQLLKLRAFSMTT